jgi:nucleotide-binding universal stress UspA family protein
MANPIIVTTDLSDESFQALPVALQYSKALGAPVILLAVIEDPAQAAFAFALDYPVAATVEIQNQLIEKVKSDLESLAKERLSGVQCECVVTEAPGPVHLEILRVANERHAQLLVMATHGRAGFVHLLIGSVVERVVREAHCPVLVVPSALRKKRGEL